MLRENDICDLGVDELFKDKENIDTQRQYDKYNIYNRNAKGK